MMKGTILALALLITVTAVGQSPRVPKPKLVSATNVEATYLNVALGTIPQGPVLNTIEDMKDSIAVLQAFADPDTTWK